MGLCTTTLMFEIQTRKQKTLSANQKLRNKLAPGAMEQEAQKWQKITTTRFTDFSELFSFLLHSRKVVIFRHFWVNSCH